MLKNKQYYIEPAQVSIISRAIRNIFHTLFSRDDSNILKLHHLLTQKI